jgi:LytT family two-component system sensor histidine kinase NatK
MLLLPWKTPIYLTCLLQIGFIYYFYKRSIIDISILGVKWNSLFFCLQLLLLFIYLPLKPAWMYLIPFIIFIGIECIRLGGSWKLTTLDLENKQFKEQTAHFNETFRIVRSERNDFLKHVSAIHFMLENRKHDEAKVYLDELVDGYEETNLSIKGERGIVDYTFMIMGFGGAIVQGGLVGPMTKRFWEGTVIRIGVFVLKGVRHHKKTFAHDWRTLGYP